MGEAIFTITRGPHEGRTFTKDRAASGDPASVIATQHPEDATWVHEHLKPALAELKALARTLGQPIEVSTEAWAIRVEKPPRD